MKPHQLFLFFGLLLCGIVKADFIPMPGDNAENVEFTVVFEKNQKIDSVQVWVTEEGLRFFLHEGQYDYRVDSLLRISPVIFEWIRPDQLKFSAPDRGTVLPDTLEVVVWSEGKQYAIPWKNKLPVEKQYFHIYSDHTELNDHSEEYLWQQWMIYFILTLIVELAIGATFFWNDDFRNKALWGILIINSITHPALFFIVQLCMLSPAMVDLPYNFVGEIVVILTESLFLWNYLKTDKAGRLLLFSLVANTGSIAAGSILASVFGI